MGEDGFPGYRELVSGLRCFWLCVALREKEYTSRRSHSICEAGSRKTTGDRGSSLARGTYWIPWRFLGGPTWRIRGRGYVLHMFFEALLRRFKAPDT